MENEAELNQEPEVVNILPLKKGRRILVYLADFFLNFILSFVIFNVLIMPVGKAITGFNVLNEKHEMMTANMYSLFYQNNLVIKSPDYPEYDLVDNIDYTFDYYISYYACDDQTVLRKPEYGKKDVNEVLYHYFSDILGNNEKYKALFAKYNTDSLFVEDSSSKSGYSLREDVKLEVEPKFDARNEIGSIGVEYLKTLKEKIYLPIYSELMESIKTNDLTHPELKYSYIECRTEITNLETYHKNLIVVCALIGFAFSTCVYYLLIPCIIPNKKTFGMLILKAERVNFPTMEKIKSWSFVCSGLYALITNLAFVFFLPLTLVPFNTLFTFTVFFYICLISLVFNVAGLLFILFNEFNKSWSDCLTRQVYIKSEDLDTIYKSRGYKI